VEDLILQKRMPEGGLQQLRVLHDTGWEYFDSLVALAQAGAALSSSQRSYGMRYVVASLWVRAENARPMAVEKLLLSGLINDIYNIMHGILMHCLLF